MRTRILAALLLVIALITPWRLVGLSVEMFTVRPGTPHFTQADDRFWQAIYLEERLHRLGWALTYESDLTVNGQNAFGGTSFDAHTIYVDRDLHWNARAAVLAHEAGHTQQPAWVSPVEADCFAEGVATVLMHDGLRDHARYLASRRWTCLGVYLIESGAIYTAVATLQQ